MEYQLDPEYVDDGIVLSVDTLREEDLVSKYTRFLEYVIEDRKLVEVDFGATEEKIREIAKSGREIIEVGDDNAMSCWLRDVEELFRDISPEGFSFGSQEGDGACFGFWQY